LVINVSRVQEEGRVERGGLVVLNYGGNPPYGPLRRRKKKKARGRLRTKQGGGPDVRLFGA